MPAQAPIITLYFFLNVILSLSLSLSYHLEDKII